jgi:hypothetical protein
MMWSVVCRNCLPRLWLLLRYFQTLLQVKLWHEYLAAKCIKVGKTVQVGYMVRKYLFGRQASRAWCGIVYVYGQAAGKGPLVNR